MPHLTCSTISDNSPLACSSVGAIITSHNYGRYLLDALKSLISQTHPLDEILVVDDSSTDNTFRVTQRFLEHGVQYLRVENNHAHISRYDGLLKTNSDIVLFLDADNTIPPDYIENGLQEFASPNIGVVYPDLHKFGDREETTNFPEYTLGKLFRENFVDAGSLIRREALLNCDAWKDRFNERLLSEDYWMFQRITLDGWEFKKQKSHLNYRVHNRQKSQRSQALRINKGYFYASGLNRQEITLCIHLTGHFSAWKQMESFLERQTWPKSQLQLILVDISQSKVFRNQIRGWIKSTDYIHVRHIEFDTGTSGTAVYQHNATTSRVAEMTKCWVFNQLREIVITPYCCILEDSVLPPDDVLERLLKPFSKEVGCVSAPYASPENGKPLVWSHDDYRGNNTIQTPAANEDQVTEIRGSGFGCIALRTELLKDHVFSVPRNEEGFAQFFFKAMGDQWKRLCDWSCWSEQLGNPRRYYLSHSSEDDSYDVDVFIPYYRNLHLVPQTIDSILWQLNVKPLIHLVNDCSREDDSTLKKKYADIRNIRWYKTRQNFGPYKIANGLFHFATSETIAIVDSDDIMLPEHLEIALRALVEYEADVYGSSMRQFLNPHEKHSQRSIKMLENIPTLVSGTLPNRLKYPLVINGTMVIRKKTFEAVNGFDGNMFCGADIEFIQRLQYPSDAQAKIHTSDEITALRRICSNSLSNHDSEYGYKSDVREANARESFRRYELWHTQEKINPRKYGTLDQCKDVFVPIGDLPRSESSLNGIRDLRRNKYVTACLASIPAREAALSKTVASLIDQVDALKIHLNGYTSIPLFLNHPKIEVVLGDNSRGDNSKFHWIDALNGYVFTCDDDLLYPSNYIQQMQRGIDAYRCLVGASGSSFKETGPLSSFLTGIAIHPLQREIQADTNADIVGTGTLGFHTEDLRLKFSDIIDFNMADISLLRIARRDNIPRKVIRHPVKWIVRSTNDHGIYEQNLADDSLETRKVNDILRTYPEKTYTGKQITVVLINYKRTKNTHQIIDSLRKQSVSPVIYVWNNGDEPFENPHVDWVINSNQNVHGHPLQFLYQYADTEFICRMDDDLMPADDRVFEDVIHFMSDHGKSQRIVGGYGVILEEGKNYQDSNQVGCGPHYKPIESDTPIDIVKGRIMWFRQEFATGIPFEKSHVHVDLTTSFALSKGRRLFHIIPQFLEGRLQELEELYDDGGGRGYSRIADHYELRNQLTQSWIHEC
ncbi:putative glycosyl transferase [Gimesia chilikensis]|uniref:Putative glycosyl transferase n=1 Tax=Gimesia chilikensis TaxID=2605989 RepID=A0A517WKA1_9PLAN|nr:glycosyltransferase [Gimesia chilikensis]QDU05681.1 putative glycosyl transferase [Gimesia chilikensis]